MNKEPTKQAKTNELVHWTQKEVTPVVCPLNCRLINKSLDLCYCFILLSQLALPRRRQCVLSNPTYMYNFFIYAVIKCVLCLLASELWNEDNLPRCHTRPVHWRWWGRKGFRCHTGTHTGTETGRSPLTTNTGRRSLSASRPAAWTTRTGNYASWSCRTLLSRPTESVRPSHCLSLGYVRDRKRSEAGQGTWKYKIKEMKIKLSD